MMHSLFFLIIVAVSSNKIVVARAAKFSSSKIKLQKRNNDDITEPIWNDSVMGRFGGQVLAESAVIDKESGRVYWESGGSKTSIAASWVHPVIDDLGWLKATLTTILLHLTLISLFVNKFVSSREQQLSLDGTTKFINNIFTFAASLLPEMNNIWIIIAIIVVYFLEAYFSNTRQYLNNVMTSGEDFEKYMGQLRQSNPIVTWKVRCFHYETRLWVKFFVLPFLFLQKLFTSLQKKGIEEQKQDYYIQPSANSKHGRIWNKKVVTYRAEKVYEYKSCIDHTVAGIWKRALNDVHFTKVITNQLLLLSNEKTRIDYFQQQAKFVSTEGKADEYAEFSTNLRIETGGPLKIKKALAVQKQHRGSKRKFFFRQDLFWLFTIFGLTLPYRHYFAKRSDILRVTVAKESFANELPAPKKASWFPVVTSWKKEAKEIISTTYQKDNDDGNMIQKSTAGAIDEQEEEEKIKSPGTKTEGKIPHDQSTKEN